MAYCKYYNRDCFSPFCSAYPHSIDNICPYIIASEEELQKMEEKYKISSLITQEVLCSYGGSMTIEEAEEFILKELEKVNKKL